MLSSLVLPIDFSNFAVAVANELETNVYCSSTHMRVGNDHSCDRWSVHGHSNQLPRFIFLFHLYKFFFFFVCDLEVSSLDLSFSGHCARRKKRLYAEETRQTATQEGNYQWLPILWVIQSMGSHYRYYFVTMLAFSICSSSSSSSSFWPMYIGPSSHWANREFSY